jgi:hypothetical protein
MADHHNTDAIALVWGGDAIARAIGLSRRQAYSKLERGCIPGSVKIGGHWALDLEAFKRAIAARTVGARDQTWPPEETAPAAPASAPRASATKPLISLAPPSRRRKGLV